MLEITLCPCMVKVNIWVDPYLIGTIPNAVTKVVILSDVFLVLDSCIEKGHAIVSRILLLYICQVYELFVQINTHSFAKEHKSSGHPKHGNESLLIHRDVSLFVIGGLCVEEFRISFDWIESRYKVPVCLQHWDDSSIVKSKVTIDAKHVSTI